MINIVTSMGKIKRADSFDKLDRIKRVRTLDDKSSPSLRKNVNDSYKNEVYGKSKATEYIKKLQNNLEQIDSQKRKEIEETQKILITQKTKKLDDISQKYRKQIIERRLTSQPKDLQKLETQRKEEISKVENDFMDLEKVQINSIVDKYGYKKQKTEEIIYQNSILDELSLSDK